LILVTRNKRTQLGKKREKEILRWRCRMVIRIAESIQQVGFVALIQSSTARGNPSYFLQTTP